MSGLALSAPRWATVPVIFWNALRPLSEKSKVTFGSLPARWSKFCSGFLMSVPERPGLSRMIQNESGSGAVGEGFSPRSTSTPGLTSMTSAFSFCAAVSPSSASAFDAPGMPLAYGFFVTLSNA